MLGLIRKNFMHLDVEAFLCLFKSQIRSHLEYSIHVWSPRKVKEIERLERVQKWATKIVRGCEDLKYEERLKFMGLPTLVYRRVWGDMIMVFNILNVYEEGVGPKLDLKNKSITRSHGRSLVKGIFKTNWKKYGFCNRVVNVWNGLPDDVVISSDVNEFKNKLDKHWVNVDFKYDWKVRVYV